jgi:hypothetical protein
LKILNDMHVKMPQNLSDQRQPLDLRVDLTSRVAHVDRGERDCLSGALSDLATLIGPAARVVDCGPFAGHWLASLIEALERPKSGIAITTSADTRPANTSHDYSGTAQIIHLHHDILTANWPLEAMGVGKTLVFLSGGAFGFLDQKQAFTFLENASQSLNEGDFVALTLEGGRDAAILETLYSDYLHHLLAATLSKIGKGNNLEPRSFFVPQLNAMKFGATAKAEAWLESASGSYNFDAGDWIEVGRTRFFDLSATYEFHPDFIKRELWLSGDGAIGVVLLQKL